MFTSTVSRIPYSGNFRYNVINIHWITSPAKRTSPIATEQNISKYSIDERHAFVFRVLIGYFFSTTRYDVMATDWLNWSERSRFHNRVAFQRLFIHGTSLDCVVSKFRR